MKRERLTTPINLIFPLLFLTFCQSDQGSGITPVVVTQPVEHDTDDPAIWINRQNPEQSIIFGTDKEAGGAIYAFDLDGQILEDKIIRGIERPNNVDVEYGFQLNGSSTDVLAFTERYAHALRLYSVPDMQPLDGGGFPVFEGEPEGETRMPMGISLYKHPGTADLYAIVGRKQGPTDSTYLWQYLLYNDSLGVQARLVRKFGAFTGQQEIEAVAVDDELGFVYYAEEGVGIRKYYADPAKGKEEIALFATEGFAEDIEGIAVLRTGPESGYLIASDQQGGAVRIYERSDDNAFVKSVPYQATETDGLEVARAALGDKFPNGLLVAMSDDRTFHYYALEQLGLEGTAGQ